MTDTLCKMAVKQYLDELASNFRMYYRQDLEARAEQLISIFKEDDGTASIDATTENMNEVSDNLFVGNWIAANDVERLKKNRITHVLNLRSNTDTKSIEMYDKNDITFAHVAMEDSLLFDMRSNINAAIAFIHVALVNGGRILIHCFMGKSRAPSVATAYLISARSMDACQAARIVKRRRIASPSENFIYFLCDFETKQLGSRKDTT